MLAPDYSPQTLPTASAPLACSRHPVLWLCLLSSCLIGTESVGGEPAGVLTLENRDVVAGTFQPVHDGTLLRWQGIDFVQPFDFPISAVSNVTFPPVLPSPRMQGSYVVEFPNGDRLAGELVAWDHQGLILQTERFGPVQLRPEAFRQIYRQSDNPLLVYPGLGPLEDWKVLSGKWIQDGTALVTSDVEAILSLDASLPLQAVIEFEIAWTGKPNFALVLGADPQLTADSRRDGWRFETWDQLLGVLREHQDLADVDRVGVLGKEQDRIHLLAYLDQTTGELQVFLPDGTPSGRIAVPQSPGAKPGSGIRLINRRGTVKLQQLRITRWNGRIPSAIPAGKVLVERADGTMLQGVARGFDADSRQFVLQDGDAEFPLSESEVLMFSWGMPPAVPSSAVTAQLQDGTRLSGELLEITETELRLNSPDIREVLNLPLPDLRTILAAVAGEAPAPLAPEQFPGQLEVGTSILHGRLVDGTASETQHCLNWHPWLSLTASPLLPTASGRILYRGIPDTEQAARPTPDKQPPQAVNVAQLFRQRAAVERAPVQTQRPASGHPHVIHLRSGDLIPGEVTGIDDAGVHIRSQVTETTLIPATLVKGIDLVLGNPPDLDAARKNRLLTIPRGQRGSPPTHLLYSKTGDFLRCRLVQLDAEAAVVEVQLEEMRIPRVRLSQIIFFHPDETPGLQKSAEAAATEPQQQPFAGYSQVLLRDGNRVTIRPRKVADNVLYGDSEVLKASRLELAQVDQILFGAALATAVNELAYSSWKLTPAVEPLFLQETADGGGTMSRGKDSPLVGQPAPPLKLRLLEGGEFDLATCQGRIVVLDFWATWCGPCIQSMPLVEAALAEYNPEQVQLVSVNLEERPEQIRPVMERHQLHAAVALDIDGVAARRYQANAIPQLVVIDQAGVVVRVFVGGGQSTVTQLRAALDELLKAPAVVQPEI